MKIGYPCINKTLNLSTNKSFRLKGYSDLNLIKTININLESLYKILDFNLAYNLKFFRISSCFVPFASHDICKFNWLNFFDGKFKKLGSYIKENNFRISMHPDQFIVINSPSNSIVTSSIKELEYHAQLLNAFELDSSAKIQIHVGGGYGDKKSAIQRFVKVYKSLDAIVKNRLVIENDDRIFSVQDCLEIYYQTGVPIIFDSLHYDCLPNGLSFENAFEQTYRTWQSKDGVPMVDYSSQDPNGRVGKHAEFLNPTNFMDFIIKTKGYDFDIMMEIKSKDISAIQALDLIKSRNI